MLAPSTTSQHSILNFVHFDKLPNRPKSCDSSVKHKDCYLQLFNMILAFQYVSSLMLGSQKSRQSFFGPAKKISPKAIREVEILSGPINDIVPLICHVSSNATVHSNQIGVGHRKSHKDSIGMTFG